MKKLSVLVATVIVAMGASFTSCGDSHKSASLKTSIDSASYAIGISTGAGYKENLKTLPGGEANVDDLIAGFIQAIKGGFFCDEDESATGSTIFADLLRRGSGSRG